MSLFDNCCLNTTAKYHIKNQKVKRNLLINIFFVYLIHFECQIWEINNLYLHYSNSSFRYGTSHSTKLCKFVMEVSYNIMTIRQCILRCRSFIYFISGQSKKVKTEQEFKKIKIKANTKLEQDMFDDERRKTKVSKTLED